MGPNQADGPQTLQEANSGAGTVDQPIPNAPDQSFIQQAEDEIAYYGGYVNPAPNPTTAGTWAAGSFDSFQSLLGGDGLATAPYFDGNNSLPLSSYDAQAAQDTTFYDVSYNGNGCTGLCCSHANATQQTGHAPTTIDPSPSTPPAFKINLALALLNGRPDPRLDLNGPVNIMRPFVVTDIWDPLDRVIFASDSFLALTGYDRDEVVGFNCRFLQSPDGRVSPGAPRRSISSASAFLLKQKAAERCETEHSIINFKKSGEAFMNHLALVPIPWGAEVGAPRFLFGFVNVFENSAMLPPAASCQSSLDTPSCLVSGVSSFSSGQNAATLYASRGPGFSIPAVDQDDNTATQGVEPMEWSPSQNNLEQHSDDGAVPTDPLPDLIPCLQGLENIGSTTPMTPAWNQMLLENVDALVQVLSLKGNIAYASASHKRLGYGAGDLLGKPMDRLYHPSDVAVLMRELKNIETSDLDLTLRLKRQSGEYAWFQSTGSVRHDGGRRWVTLTLFQQPVSRLGSRALRGDGRAISKHGLWFKLATSGLVLHLLDNPQKALGIAAEDLVGTRLQDSLIQQSEARAEFDKLLCAAREGAVASSTLTITSGRGHRLNANIVLHPGALGDRRQPYYLLAYCGILRPYAKRRKRSPAGNKKYNTTASLGAAASWSSEDDNDNNKEKEEKENDEGDADVLADLNANECGALGYEIHRLGAANQALHEELQDLLKRASQRRRFKKHGIGAGGCVNCHTTVSPEWRRGPGGERNLCNRCGLRWAKTRRNTGADADADADTVDQISNPSQGSRQQ
ncbi:uncharacterized protein PG986_003907 [Apiospora aurea]|uniref:White collar 1 protein n=1 Tax=Apiospora aurea TaxID=335848 RepID=A0ABR1QL40_9PEZI